MTGQWMIETRICCVFNACVAFRRTPRILESFFFLKASFPICSFQTLDLHRSPSFYVTKDPKSCIDVLSRCLGHHAKCKWSKHDKSKRHDTSRSLDTRGYALIDEPWERASKIFLAKFKSGGSRNIERQ